MEPFTYIKRLESKPLVVGDVISVTIPQHVGNKRFVVVGSGQYVKFMSEMNQLKVGFKVKKLNPNYVTQK